MRRTGKIDGGRIFACLVVLGMHLLFWWMLMRAATVSLPDDAADDALQVTWIDPPPPPSVAEVATAAAKPPPARRARKHDADATPRVDPTPAAAATESGPSLSAIFIEQATRQLEPGRDDRDFARDPLAHRDARLPGRQAQAFRMREPLSPGRVLRGIGALFGGGDYTTDPCPRIRENIAGLGPGGDGALLQEELRRLKAYCL